MPAATFPDFGFLEQNIRLRTFGNLPPMPAKFYYNQVKTAASAPAASSNPSNTTASKPTQRASSTNERVAVQEYAPDQAIVKDWHERYAAKKKSIYTLRTDAAGKLPKISDGTTPICLAYHLRGQCCDVCRRKRHTAHSMPKKPPCFSVLWTSTHAAA